MKKITKYIGEIFAIITLCIFAISFIIKNNEKNNTIVTNSTAVTSHVIVIDAGHGKPDERSCLLTLKITLIFYKK